MTTMDSALDRIATATSIIRTRAEAARRREANGGEIRELSARVSAAADALAREAKKLEAAIGD